MQIMLNVSLSSPMIAWQQPSPMGFTILQAAWCALRLRRFARARGLLLLPPPALPHAGGWRAPGTILFGGIPARYGLGIATASGVMDGGVKSNAPDLLKYSVSLHRRSVALYMCCQPPGTVGLSGCWQRTNEETFVLSCPWQIKAIVSGYLR